MIQALPMLTLIAPFFAVFIFSHRDYVKMCRELYAEKEVKKMSIPDKQTDLSVGSFEEQYAREALSKRIADDEAREEEVYAAYLTDEEA